MPITASLNRAIQTTNPFQQYRASGLTITPDYSVPDFDLSGGTVVLDGASPPLAYFLDVQAENGVTLSDNSVNIVWLSFSEKSQPEIYREPIDATPSAPRIKLAEIDTSNDKMRSRSDVYVLGTVDQSGQRYANVSSTSFTSHYTTFQTMLYQKGMFPFNENVVYGLSYKAAPGTDETLTGRFRNLDDGETIVSDSADESAGETGPRWSGWSSYTPTTGYAPVEVQYQSKTNPASNASTSEAPVMWIGIDLHG